MSEESWAGWSPTWMLGRRLWGKRLGIVGMGRIGTAVARRAKAFGLSIHYHNRSRVRAGARGRAGNDLLGQPRPDAGPHGHHLGQLPLDAAPPATFPSPVGTVVSRCFSLARVIVNTARGDIIDEDALIRMLQEDKLGGAGLDVFEHEPNGQSQARQGWRGKARSSSCPIWVRPRWKAASTWARRLIINIRTFCDGHRPPDRVLPLRA